MKKYLLLIWAIVMCFSCANESKTKKEIVVKEALGTVLNDSIITPEVIEFKTGPKVPKENYISSTKPFSLDPIYGREVISSITPKDGLPTSQYNTFNTDSQGNIWLSNFSTKLLKYDGQSFKDYGILDSNWYNFDVNIDINDELWLNRFKPTTESFEWQPLIFNGIYFKEIEELRTSQITNNGFITQNIFEGYNKSIWHINRNDKVISKYQGNVLVASYNSDGLSLGRTINVMDLDDEGTFFFDDSNDKLIKLYQGNFEEISFEGLIPESRIDDIQVISSKSFYVLTTKGTFLIEDGKSSLVNNDDLYSGVLDANNTLWGISDKGIVKTNADISIDFYDQPELKNIERPRIYKDNDNNIWVTGQSFLGRFENTLKTYNRLLEDSSNSQNDDLSSALQAKNGNFFYGTYYNGLLHFDGSTLTNYDFLKQPTQKFSTVNNISSLREDALGNIWFTHRDSDASILTKFNGEYFQSFTNEEEGDMRIEYIDSTGRIWLISFTRNATGFNIDLFSFDGESLLKITSSRKLGVFGISSVFEDQFGDIWIGTSQGLYLYNGEKLIKYSVKDGLSNNAVGAISEDDKGNLWIGTDGGLSVFSNNTFTNYGKADGLMDINVSSIIKDDYNNTFWLKSGLSERLTVVSLDSTAKNNLIVENFSATEGFPIPSGRGFMVDQQGIGWLCTPDGGLARFDYPALKGKSRAFPISLNNIRINGESIVWSQLNDKYTNDSLVSKTEMNSRFGLQKTQEELNQLKENFASIRFDSLVPYNFIPIGLKLPYSNNSLSFEFSATDPFLTKSTKYEYFLEGFDKAWSPLDKNNIANYGNLKEGDYTLKIKALNPYGLWSETAYSFTILPPWHRTWWAYGIYGVLLMILLRGVHVFQKQRTVKKEREKAQERELEQAKEIEKAYNDLKATQKQLIQSEKMASLGELTAGIAHEIQNPLNFVNNFSEVSNELIDEMTEELDKGEIEEAKGISKDIKQNLEKIIHHGKRADGIVKGMLQHSRASSDKKEPTDLNALADEYLRLAYHGLRAKDKSFNTQLVTDFDESIGEINMIPQDIGRVILNLLTNAFYAVRQKAKENIKNYEPTVSITTKKSKDIVILEVKDNGNGIPDSVKQKIFQPFFTTKPSGQGTGLGLSMSYDIVKAHGGELKVESTESEGTNFIVQLPTKES